jgi:hypothetical protein
MHSWPIFLFYGKSRENVKEIEKKKQLKGK